MRPKRIQLQYEHNEEAAKGVRPGLSGIISEGHELMDRRANEV